MASKIDLTGERFGHLTVLSRDSKNKWGGWMWKCRCDCGNEILVSTSHLRGKSGHSTVSCGCSHHKHPPNYKDLTGQRFGRLVAMYNAGVYEFPSGQKRTTWHCKCDCGNEVDVISSDLLSGNTKSCGCLLKDSTTKHGLYVDGGRNRIARIYNHMLQRCNNPKCDAYRYYGGRGISVCDEWSDIKSFAEWAMSHGYSDDLTLDRIDVNGNYSPDNCRWATRKQQSNNTRVNVYMAYHDEVHTIGEWADILGIDYDTLYDKHRYEPDDSKVIECFLVEE